MGVIAITRGGQEGHQEVCAVAVLELLAGCLPVTCFSLARAEDVAVNWMSDDLGAVGCTRGLQLLWAIRSCRESRSDNDSMNMQAVLNASTISTDVLLYLGSTHDSSILHMFPLNQLLRIFHPSGEGWLFSLYHILLKFPLVTSVCSHYRPGLCSVLVLISSSGDSNALIFHPIEHGK